MGNNVQATEDVAYHNGIENDLPKEFLNPDVPEFVPPHTRDELDEIDKLFRHKCSLADENNETQNAVHSGQANDDASELTNSIPTSFLPPNNNLPEKLDNVADATDSSTLNSLAGQQINGESDSSSDNAWQEVIILVIFFYK